MSNIKTTSIFWGNMPTILNISLLVCSLVESYLMPFGIIKWMIMITKYGGVLEILKKTGLISETRPLLRYRFDLMLTTSCQNSNSSKSERMSHVSVNVEERDQTKWMQLSFCGQDCQKIPPALWKMYGTKTQYLDLSFNTIETLKGLENFIRLEELILDNNRLRDNVVLPKLPHLKTLSLNNNQIEDLERLVAMIAENCPSLSYLSLLSNKACPNQLCHEDKDDLDYQRYRYFVIYKLNNLRFLDSRRVTNTEREEAQTRGQFMLVRRPPSPVDQPIETQSQPLRPLPVDFAALGKHKGAYGKCHYKYTGKHSEGNRFIVNSDL